MLFNSYGFLFLYLPIVLIGFFLIGRISHVYAAGWLALSSLFFYGYWNPAYIGLLLGSIAGNYTFGLWIAKARPQYKKPLLIIATSVNLLLLGYYKYANFFLNTVNTSFGTQLSLGEIILPLGISFFTFTQLAFLFDTYQGKVKEFRFIHYTLFVSYFPHLIAGPILHHKEMMPQFARPSPYRLSYENMAVGSMIFFIGLFKKVVLADGVGESVGAIFSAPASAVHLSFGDAWFGALSYSLQLYFDFSGYSDMAIGLSRLFGITLPLNFHSPYKSVNIIEFWRRWHMTLSRFLRDYLYIPLGGNRFGRGRRYFNLMVTMILGGLWHGAGWTFVAWGALHGLYLVVNHGWHAVRRMLGQNPDEPLAKPMHLLSALITFLSVVVAWVFFRSNDLYTALSLLHTMAGANGYKLLLTSELYEHRVVVKNILVASLLLAWFAPNTQQLMRHYRPALNLPVQTTPSSFVWRPGHIVLVLHISIALIGVLSISALSEFIYFRF